VEHEREAHEELADDLEHEADRADDRLDELQDDIDEAKKLHEETTADDAVPEPVEEAVGDRDDDEGPPPEANPPFN
jgi:predicted  nucleic acid-binding Zn-ribbon protein